VKRVAILQSSYIPWKGYFDIINSVDEFILYDDMQYTKRDWRNRNTIKTPHGLKWLSIPVHSKGAFAQKICECTVVDNTWVDAHWKSIAHSYARAPFFKKHTPFFLNIYEQCRSISLLSEINHIFIQEICSLVGIETAITWSKNYEVEGERSERLRNICLKANAREYLSGPAAKSYLNEQLFRENNIQVSWIDYNGYVEYDQRFTPPFVHEVSIIDLIFNVGACHTKNYFSRVADRS
jgi:hypothetical protein